MQTQSTDAQSGIAFALAAYGFWGVAPIYFVWVGFADPLEILTQRIVWAVPLLIILVTVGREWSVFADTFRRENRARLGWLFVSSVLLSINWLVFIYAISEQRIVETALGYFINPLVTMLLGAIFLNERMRPAQILAACVAATGVVVELVMLGELPVYGLLLAFTFGFYGLIRRRLQLPSAVGLGIETLIVLPVALIYLTLLYSDGPLRNFAEMSMLALGGLVTVFPLVCFGAAAIRLPLSMLGFFQYLAPSISLLIAIVLYGEPVDSARWIAFALIWTGLLIFSVEGLLGHRGRRSLKVS